MSQPTVDGKTDPSIYNPYCIAVGIAATAGMSRSAAHVLSRLAAYTNPFGETYVGTDKLIAECQSSREYVFHALKELIARGRITTKKRYHGKTGARLSDFKQIWCTPDELLRAGVRPEKLNLYRTKSTFPTKVNGNSNSNNEPPT
jgi:hypothetical protein